MRGDTRMSLAEATTANFKESVLESAIPVLVDFWAEWCGPCHMLTPIVEEAAKSFEGKVKVLKLNVDESPEVADQYEVMSIPTVLFFEGGKVKDRLIGFVPKNNFMKKVEGFLAGVQA
ncbi:MAG: thioredoxin [bacterium]